jgi:hypothetical protein
VVKGVKLVMSIAHDEDTCHYMSGEIRTEEREKKK